MDSTKFQVQGDMNGETDEINNTSSDQLQESGQHTTDNMPYLAEEGYGNVESESNETNCNNNSEYIASTCTNVSNTDIQQTDKNFRKRKLDEEGFVTPATPDIPKSSSKYDMTHQSSDDGYAEYYVPYNDEPEYSNQQLYNEEDPLISNTSQYQTAGDLLRDKAEEFKVVTLEWCQEFGDSENFESFCASRLDQLIADAHSLEENLKKQKEILRQRLGFISRTLQEV